jgi:hypothetical protein
MNSWFLVALVFSPPRIQVVNFVRLPAWLARLDEFSNVPACFIFRLDSNFPIQRTLHHIIGVAHMYKPALAKVVGWLCIYGKGDQCPDRANV